MIVLFTDYGWNGPYVGQVKAHIVERAPAVPVVDLLHDVAPYDIRHASYLLASYASTFPTGTYFLAVVDPGVGSSSREPVIVEADERFFIGPGNGLFDQLISQSRHYRQWKIVWRPPSLSATFHGRDLFAPVTAMLAIGVAADALGEPMEWHAQGWPLDLAEVIYIDPYGNSVTGLRAQQFAHLSKLTINGVVLERHRTFADAARGAPFFYENANGMLEIAVNQGRADTLLQLHIGTPVELF